MGAYATHAWVEVLVPGMRWVALDPTNRQWCNDRYVAVSYGRDASDAAPLRGTFKGSGGQKLSAKVLMTKVERMTRYQTFDEAAKAVSERFHRNKLKVTLGGEPSYIPVQPDGAEWIVAALGPTKLSYARAMAQRLEERELPGAIAFQAQGKFYPGEPNARWALHLIWNRSGKPLPGSQAWQGSQKAAPPLNLAAGAKGDLRGACISKTAGTGSRTPSIPDAEYWALPLDHDGKALDHAPMAADPATNCNSSARKVPAGLRLPLHLLPEAPSSGRWCSRKTAAKSRSSSHRSPAGFP